MDGALRGAQVAVVERARRLDERGDDAVVDLDDLALGEAAPLDLAARLGQVRLGFLAFGDVAADAEDAVAELARLDLEGALNASCSRTNGSPVSTTRTVSAKSSISRKLGSISEASRPICSDGGMPDDSELARFTYSVRKSTISPLSSRTAELIETDTGSSSRTLRQMSGSASSSLIATIVADRAAELPVFGALGYAAPSRPAEPYHSPSVTSVPSAPASAALIARERLSRP
jgi:hypothetical protein